MFSFFDIWGLWVNVSLVSAFSDEFGPGRTNLAGGGRRRLASTKRGEPLPVHLLSGVS